MNPHNSADHYMFLIVGNEWDKGMPPADARKAIDSMFAWFDRLKEQDIATSGSPLARMGKIVAGKNGSLVTDGPFAEAKEVVGGYMVVKADSLDAATAIARQCPLLEHGITLDVRAMVDKCSIAQLLREEAELSVAWR